MAPPRPSRSGVRVDFGLKFEFQPSIGLTARAVNTMGLNIKSFREPLKRSIQQVLSPSFRKNFEAGGRPVPWEELSEVAVNMRGSAELSEVAVNMRGSAEPILVRTGELKRTIQQFNIWTVDRTKAAILDLPQKIWYGKVHQAGYGRRGSGQSRAAGIPARPFVMIQKEDYEAIDKVFEKWIEERWVLHMATIGRATRRGRL